MKKLKTIHFHKHTTLGGAYAVENQGSRAVEKSLGGGISRLLISALGCSLSTGTASANFGVVPLYAKVDLRTRAVSVGVSRLPLQSTYCCRMKPFIEVLCGFSRPISLHQRITDNRTKWRCALTHRFSCIIKNSNKYEKSSVF